MLPHHMYFVCQIFIPDSPEVTLKPCAVGSNYSVLLGRDARFNCHVSSFPETDDIKVLSPSGEQFGSSLVVHNVDKSHGGRYACSSTNSIGTGTVSCFLDVQCK